MNASPNSTIVKGGTYVSYGIENAKSTYVVAVENAESVTLTYEGIMNGSNGFATDVVGETYNEWISFGVESVPFNYVFSGTVFNDNGGIADINKDVNNKFFDGIFDSPNNTDKPASTPADELGITGSTVKLVDCTTGASLKDYISTDGNGKYEIIMPITSIASRSQVCLVEETSNSDYPIRTTTNRKTVDLVPDIYIYPNKNFGRVATKNAALLLEKEQAINDCKITSLLPTLENKLAYSKAALSEVAPGQCIAYRVTATNRANLAIEKVTITDILQQKDLTNPSSPKVESALAQPTRISEPTVPYNDTLKYGSTGTLKTSEFGIPRREKQIFYFNTKYGTTQSN